MQKKLIIVSLIIVIILAGWLKFYFSDAEVIKRGFSQLAVEISKVEQETAIQLALRMKKVKERLQSPCEIIIPELNSTSLESDLIIRYLIYYRQQYTEVELTFADMVLDIPTDTTATMQTSIQLRREHQSGTIENVETLEFFLIKQDKIWQISKVTIPSILVLSSSTSPEKTSH